MSPGVLKSVDSGTSWIWSDSGIYTSTEMGVSTLVMHPVNTDTLYAGTVGFFGGSIYRSYNGGESWNLCDSSFFESASRVTQINITKSFTFELFVTMSWPTSVWRSQTFGSSWLNILNYESQIDSSKEATLISYNRNNDSLYTLYSYNNGLQKSLDKGETWDVIISEDIQISSLILNKQIQNDLIGNISYSEDQIHFISVIHLDSLDYQISPCGNGLPAETAANDIDYNEVTRRIYISTKIGIFYLELDSDNVEISNDFTTPTKKYLKVYPNPFNSTTKIFFNDNNSNLFDIEIYNIIGQKIFSKIGNNTDSFIYWDGVNSNGQHVSSGVYIVTLISRSSDTSIKIIDSKKVILLQ